MLHLYAAYAEHWLHMRGQLLLLLAASLFYLLQLAAAAVMPFFQPSMPFCFCHPVFAP